MERVSRSRRGVSVSAVRRISAMNTRETQSVRGEKEGMIAHCSPKFEVGV